MDDVNISKTMPEIGSDSNSETDRVEPTAGQLQTFTQACSTMRAEMATQAQQIVAGTAKMGKHPTFTEACSTMKAEIATQAQQMLATPTCGEKSQTFGSACADLRTEIASEARQMFSTEQIDRSEAEASAVMKNDITTKADRITNSSESLDPPEHQQIEQAKQALEEAKWFEQ